MKIDALRLAAFRRFSDPAAIEDFCDGINVLAGPNEMGKSTIFRALEAAFLVRHKVSGAPLDAMRPFSGGDPLVEADFTVAGKRWRIRKQFGRGSAAVLMDLDTLRVVARNAEAEDQLGRMVGRPDEMPGPLGLVWVRQQHTLVRPEPDVDPDSGKERARGEHNALKDAIGREVEAAASGAVLQRVRELTASALDINLTAKRNAAKKNAPLDTARRQRDAVALSLEGANRAALAAEQRLQAIATAASELAVLNAPDLVEARKKEKLDLEAAVAAEEKRRPRVDLAREVLNARASEVENARQALQAPRSRAQQLAAHEERRAEAEILEASIATLAKDLNANVATRGLVDRAAALAHQRDIANAQLSGEAAHVEIAVDPRAEGLIRLGGEQISGTVHRDVPEHLEIAIQGIARIRITAPGAERAAAARLRRDAMDKELAALLGALGVSTLDDARAKAEARAVKVEQLDRARARLSGVVPEGPSALAAEIAVLKAAHAHDEDAQTFDAELHRRIAAAAAARESFEALRSSCLSADAFRTLVAARDAAKAADEEAVQKISKLNFLVENLKSEQAGADEDGRAGQVTALSGEFERLDAEVKRLEAEAQALLLLARTLDAIDAKTRDAFFEPVTRRLQPYLVDVFGAADLGFKDAFVIDGLTRTGQHEDFFALSDGTREQLSVLVRLGFAELLAAQGAAVPLILDDPLVYSDDDRLAKLCRVLEKASSGLQIIILTCRATAFQTLSGRRVSVTSWRPGD